MKLLGGCVSLVLFLLAAGCSEAGLLEVDTAQDLFSDGSSDRWIVAETLAAAAVMEGKHACSSWATVRFHPLS